MLRSSVPSDRALPLGTVTFLFTDIEGSTKLWQEYPAEMSVALARHHAILNQAIAINNGYVFQIVGDGFHAVFAFAPDGIKAALDAQRALCLEAWGETGPIRVRMALHTGHAEVQMDGYASGEYVPGEYLQLARTARLLSAGHGGQVLVSAATADLVRRELAEPIGLRDLGKHRVKDFEPEQIFQATAPELPSDFPPLRTLASLPNNLPIQLTSFVGRGKEIEELEHRLQDVRLLTLTGPGGAGKTRLSLQIAAGCVDQFEHGVWFVELAPLSDPSLVPQEVATTLGLHEPLGRSYVDLLKDYLRERNVLLVLDNCEHLVEACAQLTDTLLRSAPSLKILATSREGLGITGETIFLVPPLSFPESALLPGVTSSAEGIEALAQFEAVRLFVDRARAVQPTFALTTANAAAVAEICRRLDGIPLALELAAARVRGMTVEQIDRRLNDRFRLLTAGSRTAMARHQTLQATIEWSYSLVSDPERVLLQRLAVFAGGWMLEAAEEVCEGDAIEQSDVMDLLLRLVDKSLVVVEQRDRNVRYRFLDTIRQFSSEKLLESGQEYDRRVRDRHLAYFLAFVQEIDQTVRGAEQESGVALLDRELDNVRAALAWSAKSNNVEAQLQMASGLSRYWRVRSFFSEGRGWLEAALAKSENAPTAARARAMMGAGSLASYQADYARAVLLLESSLSLYRALKNKQGIALCLNLLSHGKMMTGDFAGARVALEESLAIVRDLGDSRGIGYSLYFMGSMLMASGDPAAARTVLEESRTLLKEAGDTWWVGNTLVQLGWCMNRLGEPAEALRMFDEALEISAHFGDARGTARALQYIAEATASQGEYAQARSKYAEALKMLHEIGDKWWAIVCLEGLANIAAAQHDAPRVARLLGAAENMHNLVGAPIWPVYRAERSKSLDWARARHGEEDFSRSWNEGRILTYDEAIQYALRVD